jgi:hypothetical protein
MRKMAKTLTKSSKKPSFSQFFRKLMEKTTAIITGGRLFPLPGAGPTMHLQT